MATFSPPEWTPEEQGRLRPLLSQMLGGGDPVTCPVDGAALSIDPAIGMDNHREANVTCPRCQRTCHFQSL